MADLPAGADFGSLVHAVLEHADPRRPTCAPSCRRAPREQLRLVAGRRRRPTSSPTRCCRCTPPRSGRSPAAHLARDPAAATGSASSTSRSRSPAATAPAARPAPRCGWRPGAGAAATTSPPTTRWSPTPTGSRCRRSATRRCAATSPARSTSCSGCRRERPALRRRRLQDQPARRPRTPAHRADYAPARLADAMLHSHYPLQALLYSVVVHRYLRWRLPGYDPATPPRRRALPLRARHVRPGHPGGRRAARAGCSAGSRPRRWCSRSPT